MVENLKALVVDDTITYRKIISSIVEDLDGVDLMGTASDGKIAVAKVDLNKPDLVLLDVSMPVMDGLEALEIIKKKYPEVEVVMISGVSRSNANMTVRALEMGALDFIAKPEGSSPEESIKILTRILQPIVSMVRVRKATYRTRQSSAELTGGVVTPSVKPVAPVVTPVTTIPERRNIPSRIEAVALGVSTGGPNALQNIIPKIKADLPVPLLTVQHMPPVFTASLAERLDKDSEINVKEAEENDVIEPGRMYIAPGGRHMVVRKNAAGQLVTGLTDAPPVNSCRPSVDVLFRSVAAFYGANVLTVILTGMGNDGASGVSTIRRKGGYSIIQDEKTCVVWGMPGAVAKMNAADEILSLDDIPKRLMEIVQRGTI
ncbi:MAG: chemotaxis response regulator protein-glutamate methylesterase [bacterium]|nr:chemotaxis response regulator protein-glutamate methylesterase [bacterium]